MLGALGTLSIVAAAYTAEDTPLPSVSHAVAAAVAECGAMCALASLLLAATELAPTVMRGCGVGLVWMMAGLGGSLPGMRFVGSQDKAVLTSTFVPIVGMLTLMVLGAALMPASTAFHLSHVTVRHRDEGVRFVAVASVEEGGDGSGVQIVDNDLDGL